MRAQQPLLTSLGHLWISTYPPSPLRLSKVFHFYPSNRRLVKFMSMVATTAAYAIDGEGSLVTGEWYSVPELRLRDHRFTVPLDYSLDYSTSPKISVFVREIVSVGKEEHVLPYLLYLQGGPGFECQRPTEAGGWISKACLSTPLTPSSMSQFKSAEDLADYLKYFRADNIVNDAEFVRKLLVPNSKPWTVLGQSYGGFCAVSYLTFAPQGLKQVLLTGGIPPVRNGCAADIVYRACYEQVMIQNEKYYQRFPQDIETIREVVDHLSQSDEGGVPLPSGGILTPRGLQLLGLSGLGSSSGFERLHYMFERVWDPILVPGAPKKISYYFLNAGSSSSWSAHRIRSEFDSQFDAIKSVEEGRPVLFTGEMVFPWLFDEIHALKPFKDAAHLLAEKKDWPPLYDILALKNNKVPIAAAVYFEDMYVNFKLSMETASGIAGIRLWITNEYMHSGLRDGGGLVLDHLLEKFEHVILILTPRLNGSQSNQLVDNTYHPGEYECSVKYSMSNAAAVSNLTWYLRSKIN
ncbi:Proline iminopeptidase [Dorcoceras hygrometricum]|uniref:Proline iminopeptidase n=1 Tax=Dorcoceras hygrometricum TaxID=472368 RepID=A0A2Z7BYS9_9LAMI|nr:Proline iminopeptidase [Dorcoceras hygrometricum]